MMRKKKRRKKKRSLRERVSFALLLSFSLFLFLSLERDLPPFHQVRILYQCVGRCEGVVGEGGGGREERGEGEREGEEVLLLAEGKKGGCELGEGNENK